MYVEILTALNLSDVASKFESIPMFVTVDLTKDMLCIFLYLYTGILMVCLYHNSVGH
jgi:hypothetical protein